LVFAFEARPKAIRPIGNAMSDNGTEQLPVDVHAEYGAIPLHGNHGLERCQGLNCSLKADLSWFDGGKSVKLWDGRTGAMLRELNGILKRTQSIVFSADGQSIVSGGSYGTTNIWDVRTGKLQLTLFAFPSGTNGQEPDS
jgi:WD40 repeat protein